MAWEKGKSRNPKNPEMQVVLNYQDIPDENGEIPEWIVRPKKFIGFGGEKLFDTSEDLYEAVIRYFEYCNKHKEPYTQSGLALALGCTDRAMRDWRKRDDHKGEIARWAYKMVEYSLEKKLVNPNIKNIVGCIFALKQMGWKDNYHNEADMSTKKVTLIMNIGGVQEKNVKIVQIQDEPKLKELPETTDQQADHVH